MAKIVVCYYSENGESFYDSFCQKLKEIGNDVFQWNIKNYIFAKKWGDVYRQTPRSQNICSEIENFHPELIFSFNNAFPLTATLNCPICLLDADNPEYFWNKDEIKANIDRFVFLGFKKCSKDFYERYFQCKIKKYLYFPAGTFVKSKKTKIKYNISFIGSYFLFCNNITKLINTSQQSDLLLFFYKLLKKDYFTSYDMACALWKKDKIIEDNENKKMQLLFDLVKRHIIPGQKRNQALSILSDLGLVLFGSRQWGEEVCLYDANLALCYNKTPVISLQENEDVYNSSRICINTSHPQAQECFSWRVMDIMASNGCLLTEKSQDFLDLFGPYLSSDVQDAIIYRDAYDLRQKAIHLLEDEKLRLKCVKQCQDAIQENGRWEKRFKMLEDYLSIPIISQKSGSLKVIRNLQNVYDQSQPIQKGKYRKISLIKYALKLILSELPIFSLFFNKKSVDRIYYKLEQFRRSND